MTKVGIIRCEKNETRCPLTNCFKTMIETTQGFAGYAACTPAGVFTCRCPGDNVADMAKILKAKGAEAIHLCTCAFASKTEEGWNKDKGGFCPDIDKVAAAASEASGLPCTLGTAHLPKGYSPVTVG